MSYRFKTCGNWFLVTLGIISRYPNWIWIEITKVTGLKMFGRWNNLKLLPATTVESLGWGLLELFPLNLELDPAELIIKSYCIKFGFFKYSIEWLNKHEPFLTTSRYSTCNKSWRVGNKYQPSDLLFNFLNNPLPSKVNIDK